MDQVINGLKLLIYGVVIITGAQGALVLKVQRERTGAQGATGSTAQSSTGNTGAIARCYGRYRCSREVLQGAQGR